jgi:hypothetical protein
VFPNEYVRALSELYAKAQREKPAGVPERVVSKQAA